MPRYLKFILAISTTIHFTAVTPVSVWAGPTQLTALTHRPDILSLPSSRQDPASSHGMRLNEQWRKIQLAELEYVISVIEMNPGRQLYFLARDAERLGDIAKLIAAASNDTDLLNRIHILNISRESMSDPNLKYYLAQNGISESEVIAGTEFTFIDTGFNNSGSSRKRVGNFQYFS